MHLKTKTEGKMMDVYRRSADERIRLTWMGGAGSYDYLWRAADLESISTCQMPATGRRFL